MNKKDSLFLLGGLCLALVTTWTFSRPSEEEKIRRILQTMGRAAEHKDLFKILSYVANEYEDDMGFDKPLLARIGNDLFRTYQRIFVHLQDLSIEVKGDQGQARFVAVVSASRAAEGEKENLLTERGSDRFLVTFRKMNHVWKIVKTEIPPSTFD